MNFVYFLPSLNVTCKKQLKTYVFCNVCSAVKGKTPQVGDRVLVEATYNPNMPFKWNAQRIQTLPNQVCGVTPVSPAVAVGEAPSRCAVFAAEPEPGAAAAEDTTGCPAAHRSADLWCAGAAAAAVPAAGTDLSSFHHASAPDTASAAAAAATAERCSFSAQLLGVTLVLSVGDGYFLVNQKVEVIAEMMWRGLN